MLLQLLVTGSIGSWFLSPVAAVLDHGDPLRSRHCSAWGSEHTWPTFACFNVVRLVLVSLHFILDFPKMQRVNCYLITS